MFEQDLIDFATEARLAFNKPTPETTAEIMAVLDFELAYLVEEEMYTNHGNNAKKRDPWSLRLDQAIHKARECGFTPDYTILDREVN
jgi:hypothetical protein